MKERGGSFYLKFLFEIEIKVKVRLDLKKIRKEIWYIIYFFLV